MLITERQLRSQLASWVCRQHPYKSVAGVDEVGAVITERAKADQWEGNDEFRFRRFADWHEVAAWLREAIGNHPQMTAWNTPKSEHSAEIVFVSRYNGVRPEDDFIDISALIRNVALQAFRESENERKSDKRIDDAIIAENPLAKLKEGRKTHGPEQSA